MQLIISSLPTLILGFILVDLIDSFLRTSAIIAITTIVFGVVLFAATFKTPKKMTVDEITIKEALIIGLAQSLALIPGTSRSGITISTGLFLGLDNKTASRFSFLMAIPTIGAIAAYQLVSVELNYLIQYSHVNILGLFVSFIVAYITIDFFIRFINKIGFLPFVIYRIILGLILLMAFI
jgi:undecaprenyl-diphosphatase